MSYLSSAYPGLKSEFSVSWASLVHGTVSCIIRCNPQGMLLPSTTTPHPSVGGGGGASPPSSSPNARKSQLLTKPLCLVFFVGFVLQSVTETGSWCSEPRAAWIRRGQMARRWLLGTMIPSAATTTLIPLTGPVTQTRTARAPISTGLGG